MKHVRALGLLGVLVIGSGVQAQDLDCTNPSSQVEMTGCAALSYEAADAELNRAWKTAMTMAKRLDEGYVPEGQPTSALILRDAQRSWIVYRDKACEAESLLARGGTMQNQLFYICLDRQTRQRTEDLLFFGQAY